MTDLINQRLKTYHPETKQAEENALKEICQEIALAGLSRSGFFKKAAFQGGTCLRIMHGLNRFSEDLDFILQEKTQHFTWQPYLLAIQQEFYAFGLSLEVSERIKADDNVKKAFLKEDSFGQILTLQYARSRSDIQKLLIKLEIDTNPPSGSHYESNFLSYPYPFSVVSQDLPSLFAGKCHALLCRQYVKGRDWYDLIWYIQQKAKINFTYLSHALAQTGPYSSQKINVDKHWLVNELEKRINKMDWNAVSRDVLKFIPNEITASVTQWDARLFLSLLGKLC